MSYEIASSLGLPDTKGALAVNITKGSPADGIVLEGDLIMEFDGKAVSTMRDLPRLVAETEVGKVVDLEVLRGGKDLNLTVTLGRLETGEEMIAAQAREEALKNAPPEEDVAEAVPQTMSEMVGIEVGAIGEEDRKNFVIREDVVGLIIKKVVPGSDASRQGLVEGLVITEVNQQQVASVDDFTAKVDAAREAEAGRVCCSRSPTPPAPAASSRYS